MKWSEVNIDINININIAINIAIGIYQQQQQQQHLLRENGLQTTSYTTIRLLNIEVMELIETWTTRRGEARSHPRTARILNSTPTRTAKK